MNTPRLLLSIALVILSLSAHAQIGGRTAFKFVHLPSSARATALGGGALGVLDDPSLASHNPASLNTNFDRFLSINTTAHPGGINNGNLQYIHQLDSFPSMLVANLQYVQYGNIDRRDPQGRSNGSAWAHEYALSVGAKFKYDHYEFGIQPKLLYSELVAARAFGLGIDLVGMYHDTARDMSVALAVMNLGATIKPYVRGQYERMPFDVQINFSKRLKHLPFRFMVTLHDLYQWDIRYDDPNVVEDEFGFTEDSTTEVKPNRNVADKIFRHVLVGGEFYFGKNFRVSFAYDHLLRQELLLSGNSASRGLAGISFGAGMKIKRFHVAYALSKYHLSATSHQFTISTRLKQQFKGRKAAQEQL